MGIHPPSPTSVHDSAEEHMAHWVSGTLVPKDGAGCGVMGRSMCLWGGQQVKALSFPSKGQEAGWCGHRVIDEG